MIKRRDFLAGVSLAPVAALMPRAAFAQFASNTPPADSAIARLAIFPALGISRVGNSKKWFLAPEIPGMPALRDGSYKDGTDAIKKQVQRFRIFAFNKTGEVIREITASEAHIEWTVHVANTKASWYGFNNPLDNGDLAPGLPSLKRNQGIVDAQRRAEMLVIDPGAKRIGGVNVNAAGGNARYAMTGRFWKAMNINLGELRTDDEGRLLVFPADGSSRSALPNNPITNFSDNDAWCDDWCDGPVQAHVRFANGTSLQSEHAWVACCGPDYAPDIPPFVSLYDVMVDVNVAAGWTPPLKTPLSYRRDVYPLFHRIGLMEWVAANADFPNRSIDIATFNEPRFAERLRDASEANKPFRKHVLAAFRNPGSSEPQADRIPQMLGDGVNFAGSPLRWFRIPARQFAMLEAWSDGGFVDDLGSETAETITQLEEIPLAERPEALTRAALEKCSGGAFHPGVELTWPLRHKQLYAGPFRIALSTDRSADLTQDLGQLLTPERAFSGYRGTPPAIAAQMPGDLTRWMGIPWQCDAFSCQRVSLSSDLPTASWWPALLPIEILPEANYDAIMDTGLSQDERLKFFYRREAWSRGVPGIGYHANASYTDGLNRMIYLWHRMGVVVRRPGPSDAQRPGAIPRALYVETNRGSVDVL